MTTAVYSVMRPLLPGVDAFLPYLRRVDSRRWYTNHGPLVREFEERLAEHFGADSTQLITSTNATLALSQSLRAVGAMPGTLCVMPSWTFVASAAAAVWAGLEPYFIDVDPETWTINPDEVRRIAANHKVGAVMAVSAFGAPIDVSVWDSFFEDTGIPVVIDAAGGFDTFRSNGARWNYNSPLVISLHATKVFGVGEGSVVLTRNEALARRIRGYGNFGFEGDRNAQIAGCNAKMNEYTAAIGLAQFDNWSTTRNRWHTLTTAFADELSDTPGVRLAPKFGDNWVSSFGLIQLPPGIGALEVGSILDRHGIETRQWWGEGCHHQPAYRRHGHSALSHTDHLGSHVLGLPFWLGLEQDDIHVIARALQGVLRELLSDGRHQ